MAEPAVRLERLTKVYPSKAGPTTAVEDLSLSIPPGEIFGLLGPNGAGKTTTVRMICGLIAPTSGNLHVDGLSLHHHPDAIRSRIGLVPEDAGDYKNLTLAEELEYHGALHGLDAATIRQRSGPLLDRLGLADRSHHRLKTFSRGMRRKFHLIRALLHQPRLLLLDEPTAGLDPSVVEEVWDLFKVLAAEHHVTVVLCSHHLEEVERLCSRVAILQRKLLVQGSLSELSGGDQRFRIDLTGDSDTPRLAAAVSQLPNLTQVRADGPSTLRFALTVPPDQAVPDVVRAVVAAGGGILGLTRDGRDLRALYRTFVDNPAPEPPPRP